MKINSLFRPLVIILFVSLIIAGFSIRYKSGQSSWPKPSPSVSLGTVSPTPILSPTPEMSYYPPGPHAPEPKEGIWIYVEQQPYYSNSFTLVLLKKPDSSQQSRYPIQLDSSVDSISNPSISYGRTYGCVTLQSSGYIGYQIFNIITGEKIDRGPQYSKCLEWVDDHRVIIRENPYDSYRVIYSVFDTKTKQKSTLSTVTLAGE